MAPRAEPLPPITDPTLGGQVESGVDTDRRYIALAIRYNALLDLFQCVREAVATSDLKICEDKNK